jgi:hypothetical protein
MNRSKIDEAKAEILRLTRQINNIDETANPIAAGILLVGRENAEARLRRLSLAEGTLTLQVDSALVHAKHLKNPNMKTAMRESKKSAQFLPGISGVEHEDIVRDGIRQWQELRRNGLTDDPLKGFRFQTGREPHPFTGELGKARDIGLVNEKCVSWVQLQVDNLHGKIHAFPVISGSR